MSLAWGTGYLAADMTLAQPSRRAAVIGSGVTGLCAARQLQRRGFDVTIYAKAVRRTRRRICLSPTGRLRRGSLPSADAHRNGTSSFVLRWRWLTASFSSSPDATTASRGSTATVPVEEPPPERMESSRTLVPAHLRPPIEVLGPGQHPFPLPYATRERHMKFEPAIYLDRLVRDVLQFGGRIVIREFETRRDLMTLTETLIVNCTGLGARELFEDEALVPYKGQLTLLVPQSEVGYETTGGLTATSGYSGVSLHMSPRSDGIALGGTAEHGEWSLDPNDDARRRVVEGHIELFSAMRPALSTNASILRTRRPITITYDRHVVGDSPNRQVVS